ncbi:hypothetical protein A1Q1_02304 [Trichosporon asahii var. asahii CBS 2479]|uniref:BTB domain-containing protein n=1 Tax=Trichosporon asahii var. asahii (strain ATCC 90039 / CBS 2479 / JCM 2466 / KCTC 7840 / NBRC 103889/ NCYC 2677 / UAMH 7654) TaxID=1186058 RepID=J6F0J4_TRIAS|nr:hypothetical protein A1Q1_02304 [Trichosporon asahii var. asahii CBS 2479]EJT48667.1 hypothetical protein A1Q1_02304 [Trichosporon asahii var. asahii CBS 2479]
MSRWNLDNPTPSAAVDLGSPSRSRRSLTASQQSQFASSVFGSVPQPRTGPGVAARDLAARMLDGACETKQTAFEWPVQRVRALQAQLEQATDAEEVHDVLSGDGCYFDDLAYKLHLERAPDVHLTPFDEVPPAANVDPKVTLAIIALWAKYSDLPPDEAFERYVFVGVKRYESEDQRELGEPRWLWTTSAKTEFSKRNEYWEVTLPSLSELLRDPDVAEKDAFSIRVVVKHASEPSLPPMVHADQQFISRRVTRQAASFLDSVRTGDVRFLVLEHAPAPDSDSLEPPDTEPTSGGMARRRVIYAHSELLQHTDYFKAALGPSWSEGSDAGIRTLSVDDASFGTLYWVLRWLYTDEIRFGPEPVRTVMEHVRLDPAAAARVLRGEGWDWTSLDEDERLPLAIGRTPSATCTRRPKCVQHRPIKVDTEPPELAPASPAAATRHDTKEAGPLELTPHRRRSAEEARRRAESTRLRAQALARADADPHAHPTPPPPPPSPLAAFLLAHRYGLDDLQVLCRDTLLRQLTPDTCVASLLATYAFPELHAAILDYVSDNWADVTQSPELERCYQEVSAGVWGENHGGQVLLGLTRRLTGMTL